MEYTQHICLFSLFTYNDIVENSFNQPNPPKPTTLTLPIDMRGGGYTGCLIYFSRDDDAYTIHTHGIGRLGQQ